MGQCKIFKSNIRGDGARLGQFFMLCKIFTSFFPSFSASLWVKSLLMPYPHPHLGVSPMLWAQARIFRSWASRWSDNPPMAKNLLLLSLALLLLLGVASSASTSLLASEFSSWRLLVNRASKRVKIERERDGSRENDVESD